MKSNEQASFVNWLEDEIWKARKTYTALAQEGGISHARISQVLSGQNPGWTFAAAMAKALDKPLALVAQKAGLWEGQVTDELDAQDIEYYDLFRALTPDQRRLLLLQMRSWVMHGERKRRLSEP